MPSDINISLLAHIAADSELEGRYGVQGYIFANTIGYFRQYLHKKVIVDASLHQLVEGVDKMHERAKLMQQMRQRGCSLDELQELAKRTATEINSLGEKGELILPGGWSNLSSIGHAMIYHFKKENGVLRFYIYNAGDGVTFHEKISTQSNEKYFSTKVYEFPPDVTSEQLTQLMSRVMRARMPHLRKENINAKDLYLHNIDEIIPFINDLTKTKPLLAQELFSETLTTTGQISGTCTQRSIHQMLKHYFPSLEEYRRFIIDFKRDAIEDYLNKHTTDKLYCSEEIKELINQALINTIKICDTPDLYSRPEEKEEKLQGLYQLQDQLGSIHSDKKEIPAAQAKQSFNFNLASTRIQSSALSESLFERKRQPVRQLQRINPQSNKLLDELEGILSNCTAIAESDPLWVLKQIERTFLDLPIPKSFSEDHLTYRELIKNSQDMEHLSQILYQFQEVLDTSRTTQMGSNQLVAQTTTQMSLLAIHDYCQRHHARVCNKQDFSPFFSSNLHDFFAGQSHNPHFASHHAELDDRFHDLKRLYTTEMGGKNTDKNYIEYYNQLLQQFPELFAELQQRYIAPSDPAFAQKIAEHQAEAIYALSLAYDSTGQIKVGSFLNEPLFLPLKETIQKQYAYEYSILRGFSPLSSRPLNLNFKLNFEYGQFINDLTFNETLKSNSLFYMELSPQLNQHQYLIKQAEIQAAIKPDLASRIWNPPCKKTSNAIQLFSYGKPTNRIIDKLEFFYRDLLHLRTSPKHQATLTIDYFSEALHHFKNPELQLYVEGNLFEPGVLSNTLTQDETFLIRFDAFVQKGLKTFISATNELSQEALFFIRLSVLVNRFIIEKNKSESNINRVLAEYQRLNDLIQSHTDIRILSSLHQYRFMLFMALQDKETHFEEGLLSYCYIQAHSNAEQPLDEEAKAELAFSQRSFQELIKQQSDKCTLPLINTIAQHLNPQIKVIKQESSNIFIVQEGSDASRQYELDLELGSLYKENKKLSPMPLSFYRSPLFKHFNLEQETSCFTYSGDQVIEFSKPDGIIRFIKEKDCFRIQKEFLFQGQKKWYELVPLNSEQKNTFKLSNSILDHKLPDIITDGGMSVWQECDTSASTFLFTENNQLAFYKPANELAIYSYARNEALRNDITEGRFDNSKFVVSSGNEIFFKRYGIKLLQQGSNYVYSKRPSFIYQKNAAFPIPGVASLGFKESYEKKGELLERNYFIVPVQAFIYSKEKVQEGELFSFKQDISNVIAKSKMILRWYSQGLRRHEYPQWHYENTCRSILFPLVDGKPKPEKASDGLYLAYLYLAAGQPEKAWEVLQDIQLEGRAEELTYLNWIVNGLPVVLDKELDTETIRQMPAYQACQLKALSSLTTFLGQDKAIQFPAMDGIDQTTANGAYEFLVLDEAKTIQDNLPGIIKTKLNHYLNTERHLASRFHLDEMTLSSLLSYYTKQSTDLHGALGYKQRELSLVTLTRELSLLKTNIELLKNTADSTFIPLDLMATQKRIQEIEQEITQQQKVMKRSTVVEKVALDLSLPTTPSINHYNLSQKAKADYRSWHSKLGLVSSNAPDSAMSALSPDISLDEFFRFFPDYFKITRGPQHPDRQALKLFCTNYLIAHRHTPVEKQSMQISLLVNVLYRLCHYPFALSSELEKIISTLQQSGVAVPPIEIYQTKDVFKEPLAEVQTIFEELIKKMPSQEQPLELKSGCGLQRAFSISPEETLAQLTHPSYILTSNQLIYYNHLLNKIQIVTEDKSQLARLNGAFSEDVSQLSSAQLSLIKKETRHVPSSLLVETLVDELKQPILQQFYETYQKSDESYERSLDIILDGLPEKPTFEALQVAEVAAGKIQHENFDAHQKAAQLLNNEFLCTQLKEEIQNLESIWNTQTSEALQELLSLANQKPSEPKEAQRIELARRTLQQKDLTEQDVLNLYFRALSSEYQARTGLSQNEVEQLHLNAHAYAQKKLHLQHIVRIKNALIDVEKAPSKDRFEALASALMSKSLIEGQQDSAMMRFQLEENILLRSRQVQALQHLLSTPPDNPHQFDEWIEKIIMGGGKSKVILPLMAQRKATGLNLVVVEVPSALLKTNHADLNATSQKLFNQKAHLFEFNRTSDSSSIRLNEIYQQLLNAMTRRDYLITTGESVQSFRLKYFELLYSKPSEGAEKEIIDKWRAQVTAAAKILRLFKERSDVIIDEVHEGLLLKRKLNYAFGEPAPIPSQIVRLNVSLFVFLKSHIPFPPAQPDQDPQEQIKNNQLALQSGWKSIKNDFPTRLIEDPKSPLAAYVEKLCGQDNTKRRALIRYLEDKERCDFLMNCGNKATLDAFAFFKAQQKTLDLTLSKRFQENYGPSQLEGLNETTKSLAIPYTSNGKAKEGSQFSNPLVKMNYTIQALLLTGISRPMFEEVIQQWLTQARHEVLNGKNISLSQTKIAQVVNEHYLNPIGLSFDKLDVKNPQLMDTLYQHLHRKEQLIYGLLENDILLQINQEQEILSSNALNHADIYRSRQAISGTPSNYRTFHQKLKFNPKTSLGTDGFIQNLLSSQNTSVHTVPFTHLKEFLENSLKAQPDVRAIMDICATFTGYSALEVAQALAEIHADTLQYILYFDSSDRLCALSCAHLNADPIILGTSDPDEISLRLGGCPPDKRFTYYDQSHTVGVDIKQAPNARGLALVDERTQLSTFLQGVMRMRGLEAGQSISVIAQNALPSLELESYLTLMKHNEETQLQTDIFTAALEKIDNLYHNHLMQQVMAAEEPERQAELAEQFKAYFVAIQRLDLFNQYGSIATLISTETILNVYAKNAADTWEKFLKAAGVTLKNSEKEQLQKEATQVIEETLPHCAKDMEWCEKPDNESECENQKEQQKQEQKQAKQQKQEEYFNPELKIEEQLTWTKEALEQFSKGKNPISLKPEYSSKTLSLEPLERLLPAPIDLSSQLYVSANYKKVYQGQKQTLGYFLKPAQAVMFRIDPLSQELSAHLITNEELGQIAQITEVEEINNVWVVNLKSTRLHGQIPQALLKAKDELNESESKLCQEYHQLMEQVCYFAGEFKILSEREAPLTWITQNSDKKIAFFEENLLAYRKTTTTDLANIKALMSSNSESYEYLRQHAFEDLTDFDWKKIYPDLGERTFHSLETLAQIYHSLNENPPDPIPDDAELQYFASYPQLPIVAVVYIDQHLNSHRMLQMLEKLNQGSSELGSRVEKLLPINYLDLKQQCNGDSSLEQFHLLMKCFRSPVFHENMSYTSGFINNPLIKKLELVPPITEEHLILAFLKSSDLSAHAFKQVLEYPQNKKTSEAFLSHPLINQMTVNAVELASLVSHFNPNEFNLVFEALNKMPLQTFERNILLKQFKIKGDQQIVSALISDLRALEDCPKELFFQLNQLDISDAQWLTALSQLAIRSNEPESISALLKNTHLLPEHADFLFEQLPETYWSDLYTNLESKLSIEHLYYLAEKTENVSLLQKLAESPRSDAQLKEKICSNKCANKQVYELLLKNTSEIQQINQLLSLSKNCTEDDLIESVMSLETISPSDQIEWLLSRSFSSLKPKLLQLIVTNTQQDSRILSKIVEECSRKYISRIFRNIVFSDKITPKLFNDLLLQIQDIRSPLLDFLISLAPTDEEQYVPLIINKLKCFSTPNSRVESLWNSLVHQVNSSSLKNTIYKDSPVFTNDMWFDILNTEKLDQYLLTALERTSSDTMEGVVYISKELPEVFIKTLIKNSICSDRARIFLLGKVNDIQLAREVLNSFLSMDDHQFISRIRNGQLSIESQKLLISEHSYQQISSWLVAYIIQSNASWELINEVVLKIAKDSSDSSVLSTILQKTADPSSELLDVLLSKINAENEAILLPLLAEKKQEEEWQLKFIQKAHNLALAEQLFSSSSSLAITQALEAKRSVPPPPNPSVDTLEVVDQSDDSRYEEPSQELNDADNTALSKDPLSYRAIAQALEANRTIPPPSPSLEVLEALNQWKDNRHKESSQKLDDEDNLNDADNTALSKASLKKLRADRPFSPSTLEENQGNHIDNSPQAPAPNPRIIRAITYFNECMQYIDPTEFDDLVKKLIQLNTDYSLGKLELHDYQTKCFEEINEIKPQSLRSLTILEHISEAFRTLFNWIDRVVSICSSKTMAETATPGASFFNRRHFFNAPDRDTDWTKALKNLETAIKASDQNSSPSGAV